MLNRSLSALFCLICTLGASSLLRGQGAVQRLQDVKKIYVGSFGDDENSDLVRSKVISRLVKLGRFEVVEVLDQADSALTGTSLVTRDRYAVANANTTNSNASAGTRYHATAGVRLVNKEEKILWADDVSNGIFTRSVTSNVADKIVKDLVKTVSQSEKKK